MSFLILMAKSGIPAKKENSFSRCYDLGRRGLIYWIGSWSIHVNGLREVSQAFNCELESIKCQSSNGAGCSPSGAFLPSLASQSKQDRGVAFGEPRATIIESLLREYYPNSQFRWTLSSAESKWWAS